MDYNDNEQLIVDRLGDHVFGGNGPTQSLLNDGRLPDGWANEYLDLLRIAAEQWQHRPMWPRELVAAINFASCYLNLRYDAWCVTNDRNENTERELASLRSPSELFLMHGSLDIDTDAK
jgi:hypothetical protein